MAWLLVYRARAALGGQVDLDEVQAELTRAREAVAVEAWWWMGEAAAAHRVPRWVDAAADLVQQLAAQSGSRGPQLRGWAADRLDLWQVAANR